MTGRAPDRQVGHHTRSENISHNQQVVITGMSAITPIGNTLMDTWESLVSGRSGAGPITVLDASRYPCQIGAELKGFDPHEYIPRKKARHLAFASQLAVIAAGRAIGHATLDLEQVDRDEIGVMIGTSGGNVIEETETASKQLNQGNSHRLSPFQILRLWPNMPAYFVAEAYNLRGYSSTVCTACASSTQAIGEAARMIRRGEASVILAGGSDSMVSETALAGFTAMRALSTRYNNEPQRAMRPFDKDRDGFIAAMGSAILVLESREHAEARGAQILAEVIGAGVSNDAFHMIAPDPEGVGAALAMQRALDEAGLDPQAVDYINAHAASTPLGDAAETNAIKRVFGERAYRIPISSSKSMLGHMMGATGAVEAIACVMSILTGIVHPTINYETPDPECDLDYVPNQAREVDVKVAMSNSFGLGGQNAVLILGAV